MLNDSKTIIDFLQETPDVKTYIIIIIFALIIVIMMFTMIVSYNMSPDDSISKDIDDGDDIVYVIRKHEYSKNNYVYIYNIGMRICRAGVFVSEYMNDILSIECSDNEHDRMLYIVYQNDDGVVCNEKINCGFMSDLEYAKIDKMITEYIKI